MLAVGAVALVSACSMTATEPTATRAVPDPTTTASATASVRAGTPPAADPSPARPIPVEGLPDNFVRVADVIPDALFEMRYATEHNFVGHPINGYSSPECLLTRPAAQALKKVQRRVAAKGYTLKIYDCFRPQRAVDEFVDWARDPDDTTTKAEFYPTLDKTVLFPQGYIAEKSGHSRGSTLDLTLVPKGTGISPTWVVGDKQVACTEPAGARFPDTSIDMGTGFDCFNARANTADPTVTGTQAHNRAVLVKAMEGAGFANYPKEWWHFTLNGEPYPDTYFDTEITAAVR